MSERTTQHRARSIKPNRPSRQGTHAADLQADRDGLRDRETRRQMIAEAAYYRAEHRHFEPGLDMEDWVEAEQQIDAAMSRP